MSNNLFAQLCQITDKRNSIIRRDLIEEFTTRKEEIFETLKTQAEEGKNEGFFGLNGNYDFKKIDFNNALENITIAIEDVFGVGFGVNLKNHYESFIVVLSWGKKHEDPK